MQSPARAAVSGSSFRRRSDPSVPSQSGTPPGVKRGPNGALYLSSGIPTLDGTSLSSLFLGFCPVEREYTVLIAVFSAILGGGFLVGSLVMIMEDVEAPHHLLLLRNFMAQGLVHSQPLLFASAASDPGPFLSTLPSPITSPSKGIHPAAEEKIQPEGLRIAWQYRKYFGEQKEVPHSNNGEMKEFSSEFDLRKPLPKNLIIGEHVESTKVQDFPNLGSLFARCSTFLSRVQKIQSAGRIVIQSLGAPQCDFSNLDWEMVSFIRSLKSALRASNGVVVLSFPSSVLPPSFLVRWKHLADTLLSVSAIPDEDKELGQLLSGYQDMVGFIHVHKVSQFGTQVPAIPQARTFSLKLQRRRSLFLEPLNQAPVDGSDRASEKASGSCGGSSKTSPFDF